MNNLPWFPLDAKQWLVGTAGMTKAEKGVFIDLLCYQWENGSLSGVPNRLPIECVDEWVVLQSKFVENISGELVNPKLHKIRLERESALDKQVEGGRKGARVRHGVPGGLPDGLPTKEPVGIQSKSQSKSKKEESESESKKEKEKELSQEKVNKLYFEYKNVLDRDSKGIYLETKKMKRLKGVWLETFFRFWEVFDYKHGLRAAADAWLKIKWPEDRANKNKLLANIIRSAREENDGRDEKTARGSTPKMAEGWITARRWEDEEDSDG